MHTINKYLEDFDVTEMEKKRLNWVIQACEVLVPAHLLHDRVVARFDPDSCTEFRNFTNRWRKQENHFSLDAFYYRDKSCWNIHVWKELRQWKNGIKPLAKCSLTIDVMGFAERIMRESHVLSGKMIDLVEIARGLCAPRSGESEWLKFKNDLAKWKDSSDEATQGDNMLEFVTQDMERMSLGRKTIHMQKSRWNVERPEPAEKANGKSEEKAKEKANAERLKRRLIFM